MKAVASKKRAHKSNAEFIQSISHELLTPVAIVREGISQVLDGLFGEVPPKQKRVLSEALGQINRVGCMIDQLTHSFHEESR